MGDPSSESRALRQVARGGSLNLAGSGVAALAGLALTWVVARGLPQAEAGVFFAATSLFLILEAAAQVGGDTSLPMFLPRLRADGRVGRIRAVVRLATTLTLGVGTVLGLGLLLLAIFDFDVADESQSGPWLVLLLALALPAAALGNVFLAGTRAFFRIRPTVLIEKLGKNLGQLAFVALGTVTGSLLWVTAGWLLPVALVVVPAALVLRRLIGGTQDVGEHPGDAQPLTPEYLAYTLPRAFARLLQMVLQRADIVVVAAILSPTEAAIYAVDTRLIVFGQLAAASVQQVLAPQMAHLISEHAWASTLRVGRIAAGWTMLLVWPLYLLCIAIGPVLLDVIGGPDYVVGASTLAILACGMLVGAASGPVDTILLMSGHSVASLVNMIVAVAVNLSLLFALTPTYGIAGAAVAWSAAIIIRSLLGVAMVKYWARGTAFGLPSLTAGAMAIVMFFVIPWLLIRNHVTLDWAVTVVVGACVLGYAGLAWLFRKQLHLRAFANR